MSLLILPGVVYSLVLGWNYVTQPGTEIKSAGHKIIIAAKNRHNGCLGEKLSVAVVQQTSEDNDTTKFLDAELATGTTKMAENQIIMKDYKPNRQRYYPKNLKVQGEINVMVDEFLQLGYIEHPNGQVETVRRQVNAKSIKDAYPIPRINYILEQLREARYISSLDLKDGYW